MKKVTLQGGGEYLIRRRLGSTHSVISPVDNLAVQQTANNRDLRPFEERNQVAEEKPKKKKPAAKKTTAKKAIAKKKATKKK